MPLIAETTPSDLARLTEFLNGLDELAIQTGIRVGVGTNLVDLRRLMDPTKTVTPGEATFALAVHVSETPDGTLTGAVHVRHTVEWGNASGR